MDEQIRKAMGEASGILGSGGADYVDQEVLGRVIGALRGDPSPRPSSEPGRPKAGPTAQPDGKAAPRTVRRPIGSADEEQGSLRDRHLLWVVLATLVALLVVNLTRPTGGVTPQPGSAGGGASVSPKREALRSPADAGATGRGAAPGRTNLHPGTPDPSLKEPVAAPPAAAPTALATSTAPTPAKTGASAVAPTRRLPPAVSRVSVAAPGGRRAHLRSRRPAIEPAPVVPPTPSVPPAPPAGDRHIHEELGPPLWMPRVGGG